METIKKFRLYLILFIAFFAFTELMIFLAMKDNYKDITNYEVKCVNPAILVEEAKADSAHGYIKGSITNKSKEILPLKYLQINLYDKNGVYLGSEYKELKNFMPSEKINYNMEYKYKNVEKITLNVVDEMPQKSNFHGIYSVFNDIDDDRVRLAVFVAGALVMFATLP